MVNHSSFHDLGGFTISEDICWHVMYDNTLFYACKSQVQPSGLNVKWTISRWLQMRLQMAALIFFKGL